MDPLAPIMLHVGGYILSMAGRFEEALKIGETAKAMAQKEKRLRLVETIETHLQAYRQNQPWRE